ncbi:sensor histidine kinase [Dictyobacter formicarum]|uniref:sensor histidine kinase n=1 Tax=Dictyobacter formicarum TaxID=2778368 RepID=UPI001F1B808D|nr:HAMP domain-containing sensor histidine kinase [Dictyobacter formicarum]
MPFFLRHSPLRVRMTIFLSCCVVVFIVIAYALFETSNNRIVTLCAIPVMVACCLFRLRNASLCTLIILLVSAGLLTLHIHTLQWPVPLIEGFSFGALVIGMELACFSFLTVSLNLSDAARQQSRHAEQQLNLAYEQQQQLEELRDQFLMSVSHELRTPLTEVRGYINLLLEYGNRLDEATQSSFLQSASYGCDELELIIGNVLNMSRVGKDLKPICMQELPLAATIAEICEHVYLQDHSLELNIDADLTVLADRQQLRQVLRNLISNACKYSPAHTSVVVCASPWEDNMVRFCVKDYGAGIGAADVPHLFQKFSRLKRDIASSVRGTGLGLYISKQFVEGMGGRIWVESEGVPGKGSSFYFTLRQPSTTR